MTTTAATPRAIRRDLDAYLQLLAGDSPAGRLIEIRYTVPRGMRQLFVPARRTDRAAAAILALAEHADVYTGVLLRTRRAGGRGAVEASHLLFVEIDHPEAHQRLAAFPDAPTAIVRSGSPGHLHAYFGLQRPIDPDRLVDANRRLVHALGGDLASTDASRVLRPPSSVNRKHSPPAPVTLVGVDRSRRYDVDELLAGLPAPPARPRPRAGGGGTGRVGPGRVEDPLLRIPTVDYVRRLVGLQPDRTGKIACPFHELSVGEAGGGDVSPAQSLEDASLTDRECSRERTACVVRSEAGVSGVSSFGASSDPLRLVPPPVYFERLTGVRVGRSGKVRCLFHDDRNPSLHVYREPGRGWYCFGCGRGGSIYDLAALLSGRGTRGLDFRELRRELEELMLPARHRSHLTRGSTPELSA